MKLICKLNNFHWWFWFIAFLYTSFAIAGWHPGYIFAMEVLALNLFNSILMQKRISHVKIQADIIYLLISIGGLWNGINTYMFITLLTLLFIKVFYSQCIITYILYLFPWNSRRVNPSI